MYVDSNDEIRVLDEEASNLDDFQYSGIEEDDEHLKMRRGPSGHTALILKDRDEERKRIRE